MPINNKTKRALVVIRNIVREKNGFVEAFLMIAICVSIFLIVHSCDRVHRPVVKNIPIKKDTARPAAVTATPVPEKKTEKAPVKAEGPKPEERPPQKFVFKSIYEDFYLASLEIEGEWTKASGNESAGLRKTGSYTFAVPPDSILYDEDMGSYGCAFDLRNYLGFSYDNIKDYLPGSTISLNVFLPKYASRTEDETIKTLRFSVKSERDGSWVEFPGDVKWTRINDGGSYNAKIEIPASPVRNDNGTFHPENIALICMEYDLKKDAGVRPRTSFGVSDISTNNAKFDPEDIRWRLTKNGYVDTKTYLNEYVPGSFFITSAGKHLKLSYNPTGSRHRFSGPFNNFILTLNVRIPDALRSNGGAVTLSVADKNGLKRSCVKKIASCSEDGNIQMVMPLDGFLADASAEEIAGSSTVTLDIDLSGEHTEGMMPIVLEPLTIKQGKMVPFDDTWQVRDVQGKGAYKSFDFEEKNFSRDGYVLDAGMTNKKSYSMDATISLKGGIDWNNPKYRMEFVKYFDEGPVSMKDMYVEVTINPKTDTTEFWQVPYRARVGLLDTDDNVMLGPNVSLSEGLPSKACLEVSTTNPIPKGFVMPDFDLNRVKAIVINLEASHAFLEPRDITVSFSNMTIKPSMDPQKIPIRKIDFSSFLRTPSKWQITELIKNTNSYVVGVNYPFPNIDLPKSIIEVSQVYPCVGQKPDARVHLGFSSGMTREKVFKDFKLFASNNITLVRMFSIGNTDGVFTWDKKGKDIEGFDKSADDTLRRLSGMKVEDLAQYLDKNGDSVVPDKADGGIPGLEKHVLGDFTALLDILEKVEKDTGKRVMIILSLYDFTVADGISREGPYRKYSVGEYPQLITDPMVRIKSHCILWKLMKKLREDKRLYRYVAIMEFMNEPCNATAVCNKAHFADLVNFVGEGLYMLKYTLGPSMPVSIGSRSWPKDLHYWSSIGDAIDILMPHYWESLESYDIDSGKYWPLDMPADILWECLGTKRNGRITGIGEISPLGDIRKNLYRINRAGYNFALLWSYSGHDGHDSKPVMNAIADYQNANDMYERYIKSPNYMTKTLFYIMKGSISGTKQKMSDEKIIEKLQGKELAKDQEANSKAIEKFFMDLLKK